MDTQLDRAEVALMALELNLYGRVVTLPRRAECEVSRCQEPALLRRLFVDADGFWTWLCRPHFNRVVGWHD